MSVTGEFLRCLRNCFDCARLASPPGAEHWQARLRDAEVLGRDDVSKGADAFVALHEGEARPGFEHAEDAERFEELLSHLRALCRSILGR